MAEPKLGNSFEEYSELIEILARFRRKRESADCSHPNWKLVDSALRMVTDELLKERSFLIKESAPKVSKAADSLAEVLHAYNELNREEVELDRRTVDIGLAEKVRKRPRRGE